MSVPALTVSGLHYTYPDGNAAVLGADLTVESRQRVAVLGPNGAGKTTLALLFNGVLVPDRGRVEVHGIPVERKNLAQVRSRVGIVFQDPDDQLFMPTVFEDVAFGPLNQGFRGAELQTRVDAALAAVGMEAFGDRPPHHLSFGQRRRVAIATVLAMRPEVLIFDEPTSNLDPASRKELSTILWGLDMTMVLITHDLPYALQMCPRAVIMNSGVIVADGRTEELLADPDLLIANRLELPYGFSLSATWSG
ncbi:MAG: ATP-binding cassette domain-containing protein [Actinomycetota bacterium]|nr:ATP-binding cassette domain-containing protein [Actinomycetota bacterium]